MKTKLLIQLSLFTALALCLSGLEAMLPTLIPIYGVKLGLANLVTLWMLRYYKPRYVLLVLCSRVLLSALLFGQLISLVYSIAGGLSCLLVSLILNRLFQGHFILLTSLAGAMTHNLGQLAAAFCLTGSLSVLLYLPILMISSAVCGAFTGLCVVFFSPYLKRFLPSQEAGKP